MSTQIRSLPSYLEFCSCLPPEELWQLSTSEIPSPAEKTPLDKTSLSRLGTVTKSPKASPNEIRFWKTALRNLPKESGPQALKTLRWWEDVYD